MCISYSEKKYQLFCFFLNNFSKLKTYYFVLLLGPNMGLDKFSGFVCKVFRLMLKPGPFRKRGMKETAQSCCGLYSPDVGQGVSPPSPPQKPLHVQLAKYIPSFAFHGDPLIQLCNDPLRWVIHYPV